MSAPPSAPTQRAPSITGAGAPPAIYPTVPPPEYTGPMVSFHMGEPIMIPLDIYNKYPKLAQDKIFYSREKFIKYILPILYGEPLRGLSFDSDGEAIEFITQIKFYDIELSPTQLTNVCTQYGLLDKFLKIADYVRTHLGTDGLFKTKNERERFASLVAHWERYTRLMAQNDKPEWIRYDPMGLIKTMLTDGGYLTLMRLDVTLDMIVSAFCDGFILMMLEKKSEKPPFFGANVCLNITVPKFL